MISDDQLKVVKDRCLEHLSDHKSDLRGVLKDVSDRLDPSMFPNLPKGLDNHYTNETVNFMSSFGRRLAEDIPRLIQQMGIHVDDESVVMILDACDSALSEDVYISMLNAYDSTIQTWISRFNASSNRRRSGYFHRSAHECAVRNKIREIRISIDNRLRVLMYTSSQDPIKVTVLYIASRPKGDGDVGFDEEVRQIHNKMRSLRRRDIFIFEPIWSARVEDILDAINEHAPDVIHFSGHGSEQSDLVFRNDAGGAQLVRQTALVNMFKVMGEGIKLAVFNACFSSSLAREVGKHIPASIGMKGSISDDAAVVFSSSFYSAIGYGQSVQKAFDQAILSLELKGIEEGHVPELHMQEDQVLVQQGSNS